MSMTKDEILRHLREEIDAMPTYPHPDTDHAVAEYDKALDIQLESLRVTAEWILSNNRMNTEKENL